MQKVFKYSILIEDYFFLYLSKGAKILTIQEQHGDVQVWALVNPNSPAETRKFRLAGTGDLILENPDELNYVGTFQLADGSFVGHVFEIKMEK